MDKIRLGIIGCGGMNKSHAAALDTLREDVVVSATCDIVEERAKETAELLGAEHVFTDYHDMAAYVDAVLVVLPHDLHHEVGMFFAEHKKHILMEKPLCMNEEECVSLTKKAEEKGVKLMTAYPVRYWPEMLEMKRLVDSGIIGDVFHMSIWTEQYTRGDETKEWLNKEATLGGGQFFSHGCHYVDILLWFLGEPVSGYHIGTNYGTPWMEREGTSDAVIKFESGATGYHMGTWGAIGTQLGRSFHIQGTKGMLAYSRDDVCGTGGKIILYRNLINPANAVFMNEEANSKDIEVLWETDNYVDKKTQDEIGHFVKCIKDDLTPMTDGYDSTQSLRVIWRMYEAEKEGKVADLRGLGLKRTTLGY